MRRTALATPVSFDPTATATLFRQALQLPFINGNDSRMIPNTFVAYQLEAEPWKDLRLNFGCIADSLRRMSDAGFWSVEQPTRIG